MRLKDLHEKLDGRTAVFTFGRMNPPTIGHEKLLNKLKNVASKSSADWFVYLSSSQDAKKNPLPFERKIHYARKMFGRDVNARTFPKEPTVLHAASSLYGKGYKKLIMVVGSDRINDFNKLLKQYNNQDKPHGFYNFDSIDVVSAGERDPDAEGVSGMSASKLRAFAVQGKFDEFAKGLPGLNDKDAKSLFNEIRKGLKLQAISEKIKVQKEIIPEKVTMKSSTFRNIFKREKIDEDIMDVLKKKAEVSGISLQILKSIYEKAVKQYKLGHEIGQVKEQYAMQKVNVHLLKNKNIDNTNEQFKEWMKMTDFAVVDEATDVVVSTPTGRYQTKTDSVTKTKQKEKTRFRSSADRNSVTVKRATSRDKRYTDQEPVQPVQEMMSRPHVFVGIKDKDPRSNLRPSVSYGPGKSTDLILIKPVDTDFFNENLKELINSPYDFLEELKLHTNFPILIKDKGAEKKMVDAIVKKKSFTTSGYYGDKVYAVDTNENKLRKALTNSKMHESLDEATGNEIKKYMKSKWNTDVKASKVGTGKSMRAIGKIPNEFRAYIVKQFYPDAKILDKKNIDFGNIRPNYVSLRVGMWDELLKEDIQEEAPPGREHQVKSLKKKVGEKKAYAFAWAQHNKHGLPNTKEEVELSEWDFDPNTLLQQLGGNKFMVMTGAKNLMVDKEEKSLHMRIGKNSKGINHLKITYMPDDTYTMDFGRIRKLDYKVVRSVKSVYAEALQDVFTEVTGMYTSL